MLNLTDGELPIPADRLPSLLPETLLWKVWRRPLRRIRIGGSSVITGKLRTGDRYLRYLYAIVLVLRSIYLP